MGSWKQPDDGMEELVVYHKGEPRFILYSFDLKRWYFRPYHGSVLAVGATPGEALDAGMKRLAEFNQLA